MSDTTTTTGVALTPREFLNMDPDGTLRVGLIQIYGDDEQPQWPFLCRAIRACLGLDSPDGLPPDKVVCLDLLALTDHVFEDPARLHNVLPVFDEYMTGIGNAGICLQHGIAYVTFSMAAAVGLPSDASFWLVTPDGRRHVGGEYAEDDEGKPRADLCEPAALHLSTGTLRVVADHGPGDTDINA